MLGGDDLVSYSRETLLVLTGPDMSKGSLDQNESARSEAQTVGTLDRILFRLNDGRDPQENLHPVFA